MTFVNHSTEESRENRIYSKLAIAESVIFALIPWILYIWFDWSYSLMIPILVAPLLLLKTKESIEFSHKMFLYEIKIEKGKRFYSPIIWFLFIISFIITSVVIYSLLETLPKGSGFFIDFIIGFLIVNIAVAVAFVVVGLNASVDVGAIPIVGGLVGVIVGVIAGGVIAGGVIVGVVIVGVVGVVGVVGGSVAGGIVGVITGCIIGVLLRSLIVKVLATTIVLFKSPLLSLSQIPKNFQEQIFLNDLFYSPELLPEISKKSITYSLFHSFNNREDFFKYLVAPFWSLAYLYRWSIKSTLWFYFPLVLLLDTKVLQDQSTIKTKLDEQDRISVVKFHRLLLALVVIYYFGSEYKNLIINFLPFTNSIYSVISEIIIKYPLIITLHHPVTIHLFTIGLVIYFIVREFTNKENFRRERGNPEYPDWIKKFFYYLLKIRFVLWYSAFGLSLYHIATNHKGLIINLF